MPDTLTIQPVMLKQSNTPCNPSHHETFLRTAKIPTKLKSQVLWKFKVTAFINPDLAGAWGQEPEGQVPKPQSAACRVGHTCWRVLRLPGAGRPCPPHPAAGHRHWPACVPPKSQGKPSIQHPQPPHPERGEDQGILNSSSYSASKVSRA